MTKSRKPIISLQIDEEFNDNPFWRGEIAANYNILAKGFKLSQKESIVKSILEWYPRTLTSLEDNSRLHENYKRHSSNFIPDKAKCINTAHQIMEGKRGYRQGYLAIDEIINIELKSLEKFKDILKSGEVNVIAFINSENELNYLNDFLPYFQVELSPAERNKISAVVHEGTELPSKPRGNMQNKIYKGFEALK